MAWNVSNILKSWASHLPTVYQSLHIQQLGLIASNAQTLYALKLLRAHGLCDTVIQAVFRSVVLARFLYASQAWWGFAGLQDRQKVEGFLRRSTRARFCCKNLPNFSDICLEADQNLFLKVLHNPQHVLHQLLPPVSASSHSYSLRTRSHNRQLPDRLTHLVDCNFIIRMLFYQSYWHFYQFFKNQFYCLSVSRVVSSHGEIQLIRL